MMPFLDAEVEKASPGAAERRPSSATSRPHLRHHAARRRAVAGRAMTRAEKLEIARQLESLGVDVIEAGFPATSPGDFHAVRRIAEEVGTADGPIICGLARANRGDIEKCWQGVEPAAKPRIHTFIACS